jgi:hypothetical protein
VKCFAYSGFVFSTIAALLYCFGVQNTPNTPKRRRRGRRKNTTELLGWVKILCSLLALHQIFRQLDRERLEKIRAAASSFITWRFVQPIKTVPTQKTQGEKKRNNKNCKNLTSSSLSLSPPKENTKTSKQKHPQILQNKKQSQKPQKHTQLPQNSPPHTQKSAAKECLYKIF